MTDWDSLRKVSSVVYSLNILQRGAGVLGFSVLRSCFKLGFPCFRLVALKIPGFWFGLCCSFRFLVIRKAVFRF